MILLKKILITFVLFGLFSMPGPGFSQALEDGVYAEFNTSKGQIIARLYYRQVPLTVINFAGLAQGTIVSQKAASKKYYNGLIFHRVIKDFMIQGGDPTGTGRGGPGYQFPDEFVTGLKHDSPGILSMANSGPGTNGSQFFITHKATPWLDNKHTVFGKVVKGQDVVNKIEKGDKIVTLTILRIGQEAGSFTADQASFDAALARVNLEKQGEIKTLKARFETRMALLYPGAVKTDTGLMYVQKAGGSGPSPLPGAVVTVHYTGRFQDGRVFDSSVKRGEPITFPVGAGRVIKGWDQALLSMKKGEKRTLLIPYWLAYGEQGYPGAIPPKTDLFFDVELIDFK